MKCYTGTLAPVALDKAKETYILLRSIEKGECSQARLLLCIFCYHGRVLPCLPRRLELHLSNLPLVVLVVESEALIGHGILCRDQVAHRRQRRADSWVPPQSGKRSALNRSGLPPIRHDQLTVLHSVSGSAAQELVVETGILPFQSRLSYPLSCRRSNRQRLR